jgi:hypothetical protein
VPRKEENKIKLLRKEENEIIVHIGSAILLLKNGRCERNEVETSMSSLYFHYSTNAAKCSLMFSQSGAAEH